MAQQLAILEQFGDRAFDRGIAARVARGAQARETLEHRRRRNDEAAADSGREKIRQRADIDDIRASRARRDRQHGLARVVEFVIVVVFDDREAVRERERGEPFATALRHHRRRRKLVMRRQEHRAHFFAREQRFERIDVEPVAIERQRHEPRAGESQHAPRGRIAERFDRHDIARRDQRACDEIDALLDAARDHQVVGCRDQPARAREHRGELDAQAHVAARIGRRQQRAAAMLDRAPERARERTRGKEPHVRRAVRHHQHAGRERAARRARMKQRRERVSRLIGECRRRVREPWRGFGDERAAADARVDEALGRKLVVTRDDRVAVDFERFGELARAWQRLAGLQAPAADVVRDRARELQEQRLLAAGIEADGKSPIGAWDQ